MVQGSKTVIARAPLRISLSGGGSDLYGYARFYGGNVVNVAFDTHSRVIIERNHNPEVKVIRNDAEPETASESKLLRHRLSAEALDMAGIKQGVTVWYLDNVSTDSGIGLRGATTVSVLQAAYEYAGKSISKDELAQKAAEISLTMDLASGTQDIYAATFGGTNHLESQHGGRVIRRPLNLTGTALNAFMNCTTVFHTGTHGDYSILTAELARLEKRVEDFHKLSSLGRAMPEPLLKGDMEAVARIVDEDWDIKKTQDPNVAPPRIRHIEKLLRDSGAWAMKVMGPGGGGDIVTFEPEERREGIIALMREEGMPHYDFQIDTVGSKAWSL